jgi:hypothetical protein
VGDSSAQNSVRVLGKFGAPLRAEFHFNLVEPSSGDIALGCLKDCGRWKLPYPLIVLAVFDRAKLNPFPETTRLTGVLSLVFPPGISEFKEVVVVSSGAPIRLLCAKALIFGALISHAQTYSGSVSGTSSQGVPTGNAANPFSGSVPTQLIAGRRPLSLQNAIDLGLKHNLGLLLSRADTVAARGQRWQELSALLPQVTAGPYVAASNINIDDLGFAGLATLFHISSSVGTFSYIDASAGVNQTLFDLESINTACAASQNVKSADYTISSS